MAKFNGIAGEVAKGAFLEPECAKGSEIGINHVVVFVPEAVSKAPGGADVPLEGKVYNLEPGEGKWASKFGVAVSLAPLGKAGVFVHTIINGNVEWGKQARGTNNGRIPNFLPTAATTHSARVAPGLATNPFAVKLCSQTDFGGGPAGSPLAAAGLFGAPDAECAASEIGEQQATIYTGKLGEAEPATSR